jgi:hypothetical protein
VENQRTSCQRPLTYVSPPPTPSLSLYHCSLSLSLSLSISATVPFALALPFQGIYRSGLEDERFFLSVEEEWQMSFRLFVSSFLIRFDSALARCVGRGRWDGTHVSFKSEFQLLVVLGAAVGMARTCLILRLSCRGVASCCCCSVVAREREPCVLLLSASVVGLWLNRQESHFLCLCSSQPLWFGRERESDIESCPVRSCLLLSLCGWTSESCPVLSLCGWTTESRNGVVLCCFCVLLSLCGWTSESCPVLSSVVG